MGSNSTPRNDGGIVLRGVFLACVLGIGLSAVGQREALPDLIKQTSAPDQILRFAAIQKIRNYGTGAEKAIPALIRVLATDSSDENRSEAAAALGALHAASAVPTLRRALRDSSRQVRQSAAEAIGQIGPMALSAVPDLLHAMAVGDSDFLFKTSGVFEQLGPGAVPLILRVLRADARKEDDLVEAAADALTGVGPAAVPQLRAALALGGDRAIVSASALGAHGEASAAAVPELTKALGSPDAQLRWTAARALGDIGPAARDALSSLRRLENDPNETVRNLAAEAISHISTGR